MSKILSNKNFIKLFTFVCLYAFFSHLYFVFRYSGQWIEEDSTRMAILMKYVFLEGTLIPSNQVYPNGFGAQVISSYIVNLANISIQQYAQYYHPIITSLSVFIAYSLFNELTKDRKIALLSTFLLLLQPEFFWTSARNTHEGFTFFLIMMATLALVKSSSKTSYSTFISFILLFYLSIFALTFMNTFFASTFVFALTFAFILGYLFSKHFPMQDVFKRLIYSSAISIVLVFITMFYIYPPSGNMLSGMIGLFDKIRALIFVVEIQTTPQYGYILTAWISPYMWFFLTLFNWVIAPLSLIMWLKLVFDFIKKKNHWQFDSPLLLLLMLYAAFSFQLIISIIADRFSEFGSNMELRIFPILIIYAVPLASMLVFRIWDSIGSSHKKLCTLVSITLLIIFMSNSLLKGTNDPLVSNMWMFYSTEEEYGIRWADANIKNLEFHKIDYRSYYLRLLIRMDSNSTINYTNYNKERYILYSYIEENRAMRLGLPLAQSYDSRKVYNSGTVRIIQSLDS